MGGRSRFLSSWLLAGVLVCSVIGAACSRHDDRFYDSVHGDYHAWNRDEVTHYNQWAAENHRDPHRDFGKLPPDEQKEYWDWRHTHGEPDRR